MAAAITACWHTRLITSHEHLEHVSQKWEPVFWDKDMRENK